MLRLFWLVVSVLASLWAMLRALPGDVGVALGLPVHGGPVRPHRLWIAIGISAPLAFVAARFVPQVTLVMSPSIEALAVTKSPGPIKKGDYVMYRLVHPIAGPKPVSVTKHALCMPGDRLTMIEKPSMSGAQFRDALFFCNGVLLGTALPLTHDGRKLSHAQWTGTIPAGLVYIGSHHPRGFDSRYFGLVPITRLTRMARLL